MNNETKIGLVKEWGSPRSNVQLFVPQEYCSACWAEITGLSSASRLFVDMVNIGTYQSYENFNSGYSGGAATNRSYTGVNIYYLRREDGGSVATNAYKNIPTNQLYGGSFSYLGYSYSFVSVGQYDVKVNENHRALYKVHEAS